MKQEVTRLVYSRAEYEAAERKSARETKQYRLSERRFARGVQAAEALQESLRSLTGNEIFVDYSLMKVNVRLTPQDASLLAETLAKLRKNDAPSQ